MPTPSDPTLFGRVQVAESHNILAQWTHVHTGETLQAVSHRSPLPILNQQDLLTQGIECSTFIPGAPRAIDALGSCTMNATTAKLADFLGSDGFLALVSLLAEQGLTVPALAGMDDPVGAERVAICLYHLVTWLTGVPSEEWPTVDCGSSGPYIVQLLQRLKLASGALIASGPQNLCSLLQQGSVLQGTPFLNAWMEPDANGFVDGNGSASTLQAQIAQGVAGGHETLIEEIESIKLTETGLVIPERTILVVRNSWSASWGDAGRFRMHLSTLAALGQYCDFRLLQK